MKPVITWIVLADAQSARVLVNEGPGKGLEKDDTLFWTADPPVEASDKPGRSFSSHGHGSSAMLRHDPARLAEAAFAAVIAERLTLQNRMKAFDRLILVAAPHMLGALRDRLEAAVAARVTAEIDKDLMKVPLKDLPDHLAEVLPI